MKTVERLVDTPAELLKPINYARAKWIPRPDGGNPVSPATVYRWIRRGVHGVKLRALFLPAGCVTSEAAVREFLAGVDDARKMASTGATLIDASDMELSSAGLI
ncbi:MAG: DUF1580 domain-containing protein [Planctomycetaceae bacterium]